MRGGLVELASVGIGAQTRGSVDEDGKFSFSDGDKVLMTAKVDGTSIYNSFTYKGGKWTQDAPVGDYRAICVQDSPTINSIVSYGGKIEGGVYTDQSSMESYAMASSLVADQTRGKIEFDGNVASARLDHSNSDLALKVYDGYDKNNTLAEGTPVLKVIVDMDGSYTVLSQRHVLPGMPVKIPTQKALTLSSVYSSVTIVVSCRPNCPMSMRRPVT